MKKTFLPLLVLLPLALTSCGRSYTNLSGEKKAEAARTLYSENYTAMSAFNLENTTIGYDVVNYTMRGDSLVKITMNTDYKNGTNDNGDRIVAYDTVVKIGSDNISSKETIIYDAASETTLAYMDYSYSISNEKKSGKAVVSYSSDEIFIGFQNQYKTAIRPALTSVESFIGEASSMGFYSSPYIVHDETYIAKSSDGYHRFTLNIQAEDGSEKLSFEINPDNLTSSYSDVAKLKMDGKTYELTSKAAFSYSTPSVSKPAGTFREGTQEVLGEMLEIVYTMNSFLSQIA